MSLLNKAVKEASQAKKTRNAVVEVTGFNLNPDGKLTDQVMFAKDVDTGEEMQITMGKAPTPGAADKRTTIPQLQSMEKRKVEVGGYVRVDRLKKLSNGMYEGVFFRTLKRSPSDDSRHFFKMKGRVFPASVVEKTAYGEVTQSHIGRIELIDENHSRAATTGAELKDYIEKMLFHGSPSTGGLGDNTVIMRDSAFSKSYSVRTKNVKDEAGVYHKPTLEQVREQMEGMEIIKILSEALDNAKGEAQIELVPGASHYVGGKTAESQEYDIQSKSFFTGNFLQLNENGEKVQRRASGFREVIVSMSKSEYNGNTMWFVNGLSATQADNLTLNGLQENPHIWPNQHQEQVAAQQPAAQAAPQPAPAQYQQSVQQQYQQPVHAAAQNPIEPQYFDTGMDDVSLDDLLDAEEDDLDLVTRASEAYESLSNS